MGLSKRNFPPHMVASQAKNSTPVGALIMNVSAAKNIRAVFGKPVANI